MAPHHPGDRGLHQALTLFTKADDRQMHQPSMFSTRLTYPEHDLICFSSSFDWIIVNSQPMPGLQSAS